MSVGPSTLTHLLAREQPRRGASPSQQSSQWFEADPMWFKRAVFYEIHMRGFFDANGDGSGDFRGLTEKLDYLQWLGIDCIWLLPFYASPLRDGGYDIADFYAVHPDYGTVDDVKQLIDAALSVIVRDGYEGVSIEAIARTAGVTRPVIYDHFQNLGELLQVLIKREERY